MTINDKTCPMTLIGKNNNLIGDFLAYCEVIALSRIGRKVWLNRQVANDVAV